MSSGHHKDDESSELHPADLFVPPSPSFITRSFNASQTMSRAPVLQPRPTSSAWPVSYEVITLGQRGRSPQQSPPVVSSSDRPQTSATPKAPSRTSNVLVSPPSTANSSVRSFGTGNTSSSDPSINAPADARPMSAGSGADGISLKLSSMAQTASSSRSSVNSQLQADQQQRASRVAIRSADQNTNHFTSRSRTNPRSPGTPPSISRPTTPKDRDSFSPPPVLQSPTMIASVLASPRDSTGRPSTGSSAHLSMHSRFSGVPLRLSNFAKQDQSDKLDFSGIASKFKIMELNADYTQSSFSTDSFFSTPNEKQSALRPSHLLQGEVHKPWLKEKEWRVTASYWITLFTALLGIGASAVYCFFGYRSIPIITRPLCLILDDNFDTFDTNVWHHEIDMSGFGNGEFEMTTSSPNNSFVKDGKLYLVPTLTKDVIGEERLFGEGAHEGFIFNVTGCTNQDNPNACGAVANATKGTMIPPVMSSRITTQFSRNIQYGKVEIRAKLPRGDWMWPALWMMPVDNKYGPWPVSGEIDIMEARGNGPNYENQGLNYVRSSLNWGPTMELNRYFKTFGLWFERRGTFADGFHTYTLEWTENFLRTSIDSRLRRTLDLRFNMPFFERGGFPPQIFNDSQSIPLLNPWIGRGNSAPFDQPFFLIMNVAVGGTNGWFPDNFGDKPWLDGSRTAMRDFAKSQDKWYSTWPKKAEDRGMAIDYVRMWQEC